MRPIIWVFAGLAYNCLLTTVYGIGNMDVVYSYKTVDFIYPNEGTRESMINNGSYIPKNVFIMDVDVWEGGNEIGRKVFVTLPKMIREGNPVALATVSSISSPTSNGLLEPYPNWNWHRSGDCDGISAVFRVEIDKCDRLWVLDDGIKDESSGITCPPKILVFNLNDDSLIAKYEFPEEVYNSRSILSTIVVDVRDEDCYDTFAYIADLINFALIVFDVEEERFWKVTNRYFQPDSFSTNFTINGVSGEFTEGLIGLALGPLKRNDRLLYFHPLASKRESWVLTSVIRNKALFTDGDGSPKSFHISKGTRGTQSAGEAMSSTGILFFGLLSENSIACWNSQYFYKQSNIVSIAKDEEKILFTTSVKLRNGEIWILTSTLLEYIADTINEDKVNYRIMKGDAWKLTAGTICHKVPVVEDILD